MLRILLLFEEFSAEELDEAVKQLGGIAGEGLLAFINRLGANVSVQPRPPVKTRRPVSGHNLETLERTDPEKHLLLSELREAINKGNALRTIDEVRALGKSLSKSFNAGKSHREAVSRVLTLLSSTDLPSVRKIISALPRGEQSADTAYERLAEGLIRGKEGNRE